MGSREGGGEGVDDTEALVVLKWVEVLGVYGVAREGSGGGKDSCVPVRDLEALGYDYGGLEDFEGDGEDGEFQDVDQEIQSFIVCQGGKLVRASGLVIKLL